jgi:hypothetical protein
MFKMIKMEFVSSRRFNTLDQLQLKLANCTLVQQHPPGWHPELPVTGGVQENLCLIVSIRFGVDNPLILAFANMAAGLKTPIL